jgi:hypothetical protein
MRVKPIVPRSPAVIEAKNKTITAAFEEVRTALAEHYAVTDKNEGGQPSVNVEVTNTYTKKTLSICFWRDSHADVGVKVPGANVHQPVPLVFDFTTGKLADANGNDAADVLMNEFNGIAERFMEQPPPPKPQRKVGVVFRETSSRKPPRGR